MCFDKAQFSSSLFERIHNKEKENEGEEERKKEELKDTHSPTMENNINDDEGKSKQKPRKKNKE